MKIASDGDLIMVESSITSIKKTIIGIISLKYVIDVTVW